MKIIPVNISDKDFTDVLSSRTDGSGKEVYLIDWEPTSKVNDVTINQVNVLKSCIEKNTPVIIFDRYSSLTNDEILFILKNTQSLLLEPSVIPRAGFSFMPYWIKFRDFKYGEIQSPRRFQTGYKGNKFTKDLELNILNVIKDKITVGLDVEMTEEKKDILKSVACIGDFNYIDFETMILTDTQEGYDNGTLPDIRFFMRDGVIPLLWHKHKWLHSIFRHFVVYDSNDIRWVTKMYKTCSYGFIEDVQKNILDYLPEMEMNNFIDNIIEKVNKL